jgi:hypothetical protein
MAKNKRISGIDIDEDFKYQKREWRIEQVGWVLIWLLLIAAMLGVFGKGPLSDARIGDPTGAITVNYTRLERYRSPATIEVIVGPNQGQGGKFVLTLDRRFVDRIDIQRIDPEPDSVRSDSGRIAYEFELEDPAQPAHVFIDYEFEHFGLSQARLSLENGPELNLRQFVYP